MRTTLEVVANAVLWFVTCFAATVWAMAFWQARRRRWAAWWYLQLFLATVAGATILSAILISRPFNFPRGVSALILIPIIGIPAAFKLVEIRTSAKILTEQADRLVSITKQPHNRRSDDS